MLDEADGDVPQRVDVHLMEWQITLSSSTVPTGLIAFDIVNAGTHDHNFKISELGVQSSMPVAIGEAASLLVYLEPGKYTIVCVVDENSINHESRGMEAVLAVEPYSEGEWRDTPGALIRPSRPRGAN